MKLNYSFNPDYILECEKNIDTMKRAGVNTAWLQAYFYGHWETSLDKLSRAKNLLEKNGFEVQILNLPFGHGSNALNPDAVFVSELGKGWTNRASRDGKILLNAACPNNDKMIADSREAALALKQLGFSKIFYDDDLRLAHWGSEVQGCFCDKCLDMFRIEYMRDKCIHDRAEFIDCLTEDGGTKWLDFQCGSVVRFLEAVSVDGITSGVMVMHNGDRRHGIDIKLIKKHLPDTLFRVGEGHFSDSSFNAPNAKEAIVHSILTHIARVGDVDKCYSETTTFPNFALSPENFIKKLEIEISCGLRNIFLMNGTSFLPDDYWNAIIASRSQLEELEKIAPLSPRECEFIWQI